MDSIIYELRANDIKEEHIQKILEKVKEKFCERTIDAELEELGYPKIFTIDYDDNDFGIDEDDEF